ncbi:MAG: ABC transporter permease, partial [Terriglobales bacterium]
MRHRRFGRLRLMVAPLLRHQSRALLSLSALALGACLVTALLTLYRGVQQNLSRQFRRYGANLIVTPAPGDVAIRPADAARVLGLFPASAAVLYDVGQSEGQSVVVVGADLERLRRLNPEWRVVGAPPAPGEAWLGVNAARLLRRGPGDWIALTLGGRAARWRVVGTVQSGASEDNQLFAPYSA